MTQDTQATQLRILHFSDLHYDSANPTDTHIILDALWKDLDKFTGIDLILFSGDLVKSGDKAGDFEAAYRVFIEPLLEKTRLNAGDFFISPGNHDIQLSAIDDFNEEGLKARLTSRDVLNFFIDEEMRNEFKHIERLDAFNNFKRRFLTHNAINHNKLFSVHTIEKKGLKVGIACLNTAWRATGKPNDFDRGKLLIGERQIYESAQKIKDCDLKIGLYHHPTDCLTEFDQGDAKRMLYRNFDFLFCGHIHDPNPEIIQSFVNRTVLLQCSCLNRGRSFHNGYVVFDFDARGGTGVIQLRTYFDDRMEFDLAVNKCKGGQVLFSQLIEAPTQQTGSESESHNLEKIIEAGLKSLELQDYENALTNFTEAGKIAPDNEKVRFYLCLSSLSGRPLLAIAKPVMMEINNALNSIAANKKSEYANLARIVLGIIRYDYYIKNDYHYTGESTEEIFRHLRSYYPDHKEKQILSHIVCSEAAQILFHLDKEV